MIPKSFLYKKKKKTQVIKGNKGTNTRPRLSVYRSNRFIYTQLIDDMNGKTIVSVNEKELKKEEIKSLKPQETAFALGQALAQKAVKKNIKSAIFDRQKYQYHGRVKNIADGARTGGLKI